MIELRELLCSGAIRDIKSYHGKEEGKRMDKVFTVAILGTGARGSMFGQLMQQHGGYKVKAVCDIDPKQLEKCKKLLNLQEEQLFGDEECFFAEKRADVMVIATYDKEHVRQCVRAMKMGYDILLEKPVSDSREELNRLLEVQKETKRQVAVCHELRYGPGFEKLSELLEGGVIGKLIAIDAMERVAYWHQAQAYVRIQSDRNDVSYPTILAKCSHDLDLVQHYAGAECNTVSSIGALSFFREENAPEGSTERCLDCPYKESCPYSAWRIYVDGWKRAGCPEFIWPYNKVSLKKPTTEADLYEGIRTTYFGKCVFRCGVETNPTVVDHQLVQMQFANGVTAVLKMVFAQEPGRRINLFGTYGELLLDERSDVLEIRPYGGEKKVIALGTLVEGGNGHGGGDARIVAHLYSLLSGEGENRTSLRESVESHLMGIAAEESRHGGGKLVKVHG